MPTSAAPRSAATIAEIIAAKQQRTATLQARQQAIAADLARLRDEEARALADGADTTASATEIQSLADESERIRRALHFLGEELSRLTLEGQASAITEIAASEAVLITKAESCAQALETGVRASIAETLLPLADALDAALSAARATETEHDRLHRLANPHADERRPDRTGKVRARRGQLFLLIGELRRYVGDRSHGGPPQPAPRADATSSLAFR